MIRVVEGNLFENITPCNIILHQVNCLGIAGAGIAYDIRKRYPDWFESYKEHCKQYRPDALLGSFHTYDVPNTLVKICSVFGQKNIGKERRQTDYDAWQNALFEIVFQLEIKYGAGEAWTVRIPYGIGCGLGGGDWHVMKDLFEYCAGGSPVDFVFYKLPGTR